MNHIEQGGAASQAIHKEKKQNRGAEPIDIQNVIPLAQNGDDQAIRTLFGFTNKVVRRTLYGMQADLRANVDIENLGQEVVLEFFSRHLYTYDPQSDIPDRVLPMDKELYQRSAYRKYLERITKSRYIDELRKLGRQNIHYIETPRYPTVDITGKLVEDAKAQGILSKKQEEALQRRATGMSEKAVAEDLGITVSSAKAIVFGGIRKLEENFLFPNGFISYQQTKLPTSCRLQGYIQAIRILRCWYTKPEYIEEYKRNHVLPPKPGYALLTEFLPSKGDKKKLYHMVINNLGLASLEAIIRDSRVYIRPDKLKQFFQEKAINVDLFPTVTDDA